MTKDEITDLILESMRDEVAKFVDQQGKITSSTQYESKALELGRKFTAGLITHSAGKLPKSRNAKKSPNPGWFSRIG